MPKIVVDDFGGKRSDPGMLGSGLYFAESASLSCKFSKPGKSRPGTRLMLVNQVALGRVKVLLQMLRFESFVSEDVESFLFCSILICQEYYSFQKDLKTPPQGYDSVKGVKDENTDFKVGGTAVCFDHSVMWR